MHLPPQSRNKNVPSPTRLSSHRAELLTSPNRRDLHSWRKSLGAERNEGRKRQGLTAAGVQILPHVLQGPVRVTRSLTHTSHIPIPFYFPPCPQRSVLLPHIVGSHMRGPLSLWGLQRRPPNCSTPEHWPRENRFTENFGCPQRLDQKWWWKHI